MMDNQQFFILLKQNIAFVFNDISNKEDLFAFGIYTDQDVSTILIGYNTYTYFANQLAELFLKQHKIVSYNRWCIPEWYKSIGDENIFVDKINDTLYNIIQLRESELYPDSFKNNILDLLCNALLELREEGLFNSMNKDFMLYLHKGDSYVGEKMKQRIRNLVGEKYYEDFIYELKYGW